MQYKSRITFFQGNLRRIRSFLSSLLVMLIVTAATCSCDGNNKRMIEDAPSALCAHEDFIRKVSSTKERDIHTIITMTKEWYVLSDTLRRHVQCDSVCQKVYDLKAYNLLQDSITNLLCQMVDAEVRSLEDVLEVREALSEMSFDTTIMNVCADAHKFFESLDMAKVPKQTTKDALDGYTILLKNYLRKDIRTKADMERFIRAEDIAFRGFLAHLHEMGQTSLENISNSTETICNLIFKSANDGQITAETSIVYMLMRTNRRILQNAMTCLADCKEGRVTGDSEQAVAYLWMMMKPFFPMDDLSQSLLSNLQKENLRTLAADLPKVADKLYGEMGWSPLPMDELPNEIIKETIRR